MHNKSNTIYKTKVKMAKIIKILFFKRNVLSFFLKTDTEELFLMLNGRIFQSVGAATKKDLAPYDLKLKRGT